MNYRTLSLVYDRLTGDRGGEVDRIRHLLERYNPKAQSLVEFACGSGAVLKHLTPYYEVAGMDLSRDMLAIARQKLRGVRLAAGSMTTYTFHRKFDIVLCLFDSVNHLHTFKDWKLLFANAAQHLNPNGIFCFDINTVARLAKLTGTSSVVPCGPDFVSFRVKSGGKNRVTWNIDVFKHEQKDHYRLLRERIEEIAFPVKEIVPALKRHFGSIVMLDEEGKKTSRDEGRRYFFCRIR